MGRPLSFRVVSDSTIASRREAHIFEKRELEASAGSMVARALGSQRWEHFDDGSKPAMVDIVVFQASRQIALEVTTHHDKSVPVARATLAELPVIQPLDQLEHDWCVQFETAQLRRARVHEASQLLVRDEQRLLRLSLLEPGNAVSRSNLPTEFVKAGIVQCYDFGARRDLTGGYIYFSHGQIGSGEWATEAIAAILNEAVDNQTKLRQHDAVERHLFIHIDAISGSTLDRLYRGLEPCPSDPFDVIDKVWAYSKWDSSWLYQLVPGTSDWRRYESSTGRQTLT